MHRFTHILTRFLSAGLLLLPVTAVSQNIGRGRLLLAVRDRQIPGPRPDARDIPAQPVSRMDRGRLDRRPGLGVRGLAAGPIDREERRSLANSA